MTTSHLTTEERQTILRACELFAGMTEETLGLLAEIAAVETFRPGEVVCEIGEPGDAAFVVAEGGFDVHVDTAEARVRTLSPGDLFGEYAMFSEGRRTARVVAGKGGGRLLAIPHQRFRPLLLAHPESSIAVAETAVRRLLDAEDRLRQDMGDSPR